MLKLFYITARGDSMKINKKTVLYAVILTVAAVNLVSLILSYASAYLLSSAALSYVSEYFSTLSETVLPTLTAVAMFCVYAASGIKKSLLYAVFYSLTWFFFFLASYFIDCSYSGYEIGYSLLFSALGAMLMAVAMYAELVVLFFIIVFASRIFASKRYGAGHEPSEYIFSEAAFDFQCPVTVGIFASSAALFFYNLGIEIANTVSFILDCAGIYTAGEIFYLVFRYIFILALLILSHYLSHLSKKLFIKPSV